MSDVKIDRHADIKSTIISNLSLTHSILRLSYNKSEKNVLLVSRCLHAVLCVYIFVSSNEAGSGGRWNVNKYYITQHVPPPPITPYKGEEE